MLNVEREQKRLQEAALQADVFDEEDEPAEAEAAPAAPAPPPAQGAGGEAAKPAAAAAHHTSAEVSSVFAELDPEEAERAVRKIQSIQRGRIARKRVAGIRASVRTEHLSEREEHQRVAEVAADAVVDAFAELNTEEVEAAVLKIQAVHRGRLARKTVKGLKEGAPTEAEAAGAGAELTAAAEDAAEVVAAAFQDLDTEEVAAAVLKIQAVHRGRIARKTVKGLKAAGGGDAPAAEGDVPAAEGDAAGEAAAE